jgi:uncharacterized protein YkvS
LFGNLTQKRYSLAACGSSTRGLFGGGYADGPVVNTIDYVTIASVGNAIDFGDLTQVRSRLGSCSSDTRGVFGGGSTDNSAAGAVNTIDYVTIASVGNATDFGDLTRSDYSVTGCASPTRGLFAGSFFTGSNVIDYITIASTGNALDFGDLSTVTTVCGVSSSTRGVFASNESGSNVIQYVTIATTGNATDFGDLPTSSNYSITGTSSPTRGLFMGGFGSSQANVINYITIATTGDAIDFGDLSPGLYSTPGCTSNCHGGI